MIKNKRGQIFLVAAVIIVGLIFGASRTLNYASAGSDQEAFYDLTEELDFEVKKVLDYGIISSANIESLTLNFLNEYTENIVNEEVVYIIGNANFVLKAVHYDNSVNPNLVTLQVSGTTISVPIQYTTQTFADVIYDSAAKKVTVTIRGIPYEFNLRSGEAFYFVIIKDDDDEKFVST